jgi:RNA polymerase sigma factor (sigma-70 family)
LEIPAENGDELSIGREVLADPAAEEEYQLILSRIEIEQVRDLSRTLTDREREVVYRHYGLEGRPAQTLRQIGEALGISAERVHQIEARALEKLRDAVLGRQT